MFSSSVDHELTAEESRALEEHLEVCADCRARWTSFSLTVQLVRRLPQVEPPPTFVGRVLDRVRAYEATGEPVPAPVVPGLRDLWRRFSGSLRVPFRVPTPAWVVACLAIGVLVGLAVNGSGIGRTTPASPAPTLAEADATSPALAPGAVESTFVSAPPGDVRPQPRPFKGVVNELEQRLRDRATENTGQPEDPSEVFDPMFFLGPPTGLQREVNAQDDVPRITF
jgi:anti-sigma factor RsiW